MRLESNRSQYRKHGVCDYQKRSKKDLIIRLWKFICGNCFTWNSSVNCINILSLQYWRTVYTGQVATILFMGKGTTKSIKKLKRPTLNWHWISDQSTMAYKVSQNIPRNVIFHHLCKAEAIATHNHKGKMWKLPCCWFLFLLLLLLSLRDVTLKWPRLNCFGVGIQYSIYEQ